MKSPGKNAAWAEKGTAAAQSLQDQAMRLNMAMGLPLGLGLVKFCG